MMLWFLLCAATYCGFACAQESNGIRLAGRVELSRLADYIAATYDITVVYDPSKLNDTVTIRSGAPLSDAELWHHLNDQLAERGMTTIALRSPGSYEIVMTRDAAKRVVPTTTDAPRPDPLPGFLSVLISPTPLSPEAASALVRPVLTPQVGSAEVIPGTGRLLLSDLADRVDIAVELIETQRRSLESIETRPISVPNGRAATTLASIESLATLDSIKRNGRVVAGPDDATVVVVAPPEEISYWTGLISRLAMNDRIVVADYSVPGLGSARLRALLDQAVMAASPETESLRAFENPISDSVSVWATEELHAVLREIVASLTGLPGSAPQETVLVPVQHRGADEIAAQIREIMGSDNQDQLASFENEFARESKLPSERDNGWATPPPIESTLPGLPRLRISVDEPTNNLILTGTPKELDEARVLIAKLDTPVTQVMLEVRLVSLTDSQTMDLGIELTKVEVDGDTVSRISSLFGLGLGANAATLPGAGAGLTGVVFDPGEFAVLIQALETVNDGRTLSAPRVLVGNNESADFNSVLEQPVVSINASDVVATTSFGGFEPAGTTISVQPQILAGNRLNLQYSVSLSSFVGESADPSIPPPRQQNQLSSMVTIPDGHAIAVGGIELVSEGEAVSQIPLLGDVPWLGELFKTRSMTQSRTRFYVFIRATVHRDEMLERLKYTSRTLADEIDLPDDWPKLKPRVIR